MKVAVLTGSNRSNSSSTKLAIYVGERLKAGGHEVGLWNLHSNPLPFYDPSDDNQPESVQQLSRLLTDADAIVLSTPEYHGSLSGVLKNALDYLDDGHFGGKMVLCLSSAGGAVGVSSLQQMQVIVRNVHGVNCPDWISIGGDSRRFEESGEPVNAALRSRVERVVESFVRLASKLRN